MIRWLCLVLAMSLLVPVRTDPKSSDDDEERNDDNDNDNDEDDNEDDDDDDSPVEKPLASAGRRAPILVTATRSTTVTASTLPHPLECVVCAYKSDTMFKSCLEPNKYRVHTMVCHSADDKCFTTAVMKDNNYETVIRGCRSACVPTADTTCCETNRCNNQELATPEPLSIARALVQNTEPANGQTKASVPSVLFFVTILLVLQTVVKVAIV